LKQAVRIGFLVVIKGVSSTRLHKADAGAVAQRFVGDVEKSSELWALRAFGGHIGNRAA
jgi:hypothetical protein